MSGPGRTSLLWGPRILGILAALFAASLSMDAVGEGAAALLMHLLPAIVLLAVVAVGWRRPLVGGLAFLALAALYVATTPTRIDWILTIAAPLSVIGGLFVWSWWAHRTGTPRG